MSAAPVSARSTPWLAVALLAIVALCLRLSALDSGLPQRPDPDSIVFHDQVEHLERNDPHPERDLTFGFYPLLVARITALVFEPAPTTPPARDLDLHLARASSAHLHLRIVVAVLSVLAVPGTFLLARRFLSSLGALVAAMCMATSTLNLWFAVQARPHAVSSALALLAVLAALNLRRRRDWVAWAWTGLAFGLAIGSLESGVLVLGSFAAALLLREAPTTNSKPAGVLGAALAVGLVALCVFAFYPFLFAASEGRDAARIAFDGNELDLFGHVIYLRQFDGRGFATIAAALRDYDPWLALLGLVGGLLALARLRVRVEGRPWKDLVVVLAFVVPYLLVFGAYQRTYQRFVLPLLPFVVLLAAYAVERAVAAVRERRFAPALALALVAPQIALAVGVNAARRAPDTVTRASTWIAEHLEPGADRILWMPTFDLRLPYSLAAQRESGESFDTPKRPWFRYQLGLAIDERPTPTWNVVALPLATDEQRAHAERDPAGYLRELHADYAVIEVYEAGRPPPALRAVRLGLLSIADRVQRFSPEVHDSEDALPLVGQDDEFPRTHVWAWRAARARCLGPVIEIWKLRDGARAR
ncbi:MAG: glycosyltransferase family 39 protein [Planctomycetes bacterium]|nr:glycosyltransferase family 39 protein [Planctomycetota bacterium]